MSTRERPATKATLEGSRRAYEERLAQEQQQRAPDIDSVTMERWNSWVDARIEARIISIVEVLAEETGNFVHEENLFLRAELQKLRSELHAQHERDIEEIESLAGIDGKCWKRNVAH